MPFASLMNDPKVQKIGTKNDNSGANKEQLADKNAKQRRKSKKSCAPIAPSNYNMKVQQGRVKNVMSGDTIVLVNPNGQERTLSLAYVTAPHLRKDHDDPFAFESREFLRSRLVGKMVQFKVLYTIPNTNREYGLVMLDGLRYPEEPIKQGWLKLREDAGHKENTEDAQMQLNELKLYAAQAREADRGLWAPSGGRIDCSHDLGKPADAFIEQYKGQLVDGVVERVLSGDRMLLRLILSPTKHVQIMTLVAGIRAPTTERTTPSNGKVQPAEPHGNEARDFVETRLLQRTVKVKVLGLSPQGQLIASVIHPNGSIAEFLLEEGLARCTDFHSTMLGTDMAPLRAAEKSAQSQQKGVFRGHVNQTNGSSSSSEVIVTKVFSADVVFIQSKSGPEKRINISSVRGPRQNEASEAPFREEAKEYLRKKIIGKKVHATMDGSRPAVVSEAGQAYDAKEVATIMLGDKNIGLQLVQDGWASVIRHKRDDPDRASNYDELLAAGEKAKEEKKGMWSGKPTTARSYIDQSESVQKAKLGLGTLQRQRKIPAIVDFVKGGGRFTILVPKESMRLNFVLGGIRAPKSARGPQDKAEPFGHEAHELATQRLNQRDVQIDVTSIDKVGGFIGELYIGGVSFAKVLVEEGLATVHEYSAEQAGTYQELSMAQDRAKQARKNLWKDWTPEDDAAPQEEHSNGTNGTTDIVVDRKKNWKDVVVTDVTAEGKIKVQFVGTSTGALEQLMSAFKSFHISPSNAQSLPGPPKAGDYVAAKFSEDGQWYRARIRSNDRANKQADIVFIDYGNAEKQAWDKLRPLSQPQFSTSKLPAQAREVALTCLELPTQPEYLKDFISYFHQLTANKQLVANIDYTDKDGLMWVTLVDDPEGKGGVTSVNEELLIEGLAMVPVKLKPWERSFSDVIEQFRKLQTTASENHYGIWEYGDPTGRDEY